ncbi:hypothetical protein A3224_01245 [Microbulbifer thermotolerans]|nr:hypothetical protein A3224_01245 [Microbulbifer thermotolerans]
MGIFGKLPGHGDFIQRQLPASFVTPWDEWLQRAVHGSRELVGESWLDYFLTAPVWRFALSPGVLDERGWAGVLVPSVDSVGRYFPLTLAAPVSGKANPFALQLSAEGWYRELSNLAIEALQNALLADQLMERFPQLAENIPATDISLNAGGVLKAVGENSDIASCYPGILDYLYRQQFPAFGLWWCVGSQQLAPNALLCPSLPDPGLYASMLGAPELRW